MLKKVLVANRGEIALRIIRACHELGIEPVAVCSEADRRAAHVLAAGEFVLLGPAAATESYLNVERLLEAARDRGCDAVHPGYGFLAERASFARAVEEAGLVFVGPSSSAIEAMGDKTRARQAMIAAGVPVVPGTAEPLADAADAERTAAEVGYPVMLKAAAGGGGKGMRVVRDPAELTSSFEAASREARAAFGDGSVYVERYLDGPRHIEIQVLADARGHTIHLGERECSIQRRHQKMIEEAPSPAITPELRGAMGEAAVAAAEAVGYRNAGTVEFLFQDGAFFFLEMNTRIQVEHPVTELVTGVDLVQWQLRIAAGEALTLTQDEVRMSGHAIECRITSEDPGNGFLPSTGRIDLLHVPAGPGVRWDGGVQEGDEVSLHYDPMLAKLVVHAPTRDLAVARMARALAELRIVGVETSATFHRRVLAEDDFRAGRLDIRYLERHPALTTAAPTEEAVRAAAIAAALLEEEDAARRDAPRVEAGGPGSRWRDTGWR
ncbi:MAG TPA: acetyl-CoA carboxylase biotin carboxylase subunit [Longimicrobiales bacterium]|nr:acetyl-CoA carboxylase biotin carboxylase subunit [Longimicrobiales bacterium]